MYYFLGIDYIRGSFEIIVKRDGFIKLICDLQLAPIARITIDDSQLFSIYKKAEAARYIRNKRNPAVYTLEQFDKWRVSAKRAFEQAKKGELSAEELKKAISGG